MKNKNHKKLILVVEDDGALQEAVKLKLENKGYSVFAVKTGEEAFDFLKNETPQLIWLDVMLPGMSGLEFLKKIKQESRLKDLPVVVVTVSVENTQKRKEIEQFGVVDYIMKSGSSLESIVNKVVNFIPA